MIIVFFSEHNILHFGVIVIDETYQNPFFEFTISCSDNNVLLILLHCIDNLCSTTVFGTYAHNMPLRQSAEKLGRDICKNVLGFHAPTDYDQTGKCFGFSKMNSWETSMVSPPSTWKAFERLGRMLVEETGKQLVNCLLNLYMKQRPKPDATLST